ncbi:winged helix-turn-helix domain-containing protein [Streptomyces polygonati]|uniref:Winged helix-turn-helix domain-containing protein n=1 Tax=Streptomyces polygonati TaxID=1617087 RepID=A0ABV8HDN8_9ACTN
MQSERTFNDGPPAGSPGGRYVLSVEELLRRARDRLVRLTPQQAADEQREGDALLVDIRSEMLRRAQGEIPGSLVLERNVLEWRLDPLSHWRIDEAADHSLRVVVVCPQGYMSSLAAATLQDLGMYRATDLDGGFEAWAAAGLPVTPGPTMPGSYVDPSPAATISLDPVGQRILVAGTPIPLTRLEFRLVSELLRGNGRVVSRAELRASIGEWAGSRSRSVDLHMHRIRRKLEPHTTTLLTTERGVGFRLRVLPCP